MLGRELNANYQVKLVNHDCEVFIIGIYRMLKCDEKIMRREIATNPRLTHSQVPKDEQRQDSKLN
jgi:hypothetical protein